MKIMGVDSAWNLKNPSGIAIVEKKADIWECIFFESQKFFSLENMLQQHPDIELIVADIPLVFQGEFYGRRAADNEISQNFGSFKCSTHTVSEKCHPFLEQISIELIKTAEKYRIPIIETYPHPAILSLFAQNGIRLQERLQYKVAKQYSYWPQFNVVERKRALLNNLRSLIEIISTSVNMQQVHIPIINLEMRKKEIKNLEDCLDALVCSWVGIQYLQSNCLGYGDEKAKIWIPNM